MLPLPRHQNPSLALLQGGQRNGTEKPLSKKKREKKKNKPSRYPSCWPLISPGHSHAGRGESVTGKARPPHFPAFEGEKQPCASKRCEELRHGRRFAAGSAASAEHGRCQERPLAHSQPGHGADELKYLLNRSIRAGNATCRAWERAAGKGAGWTDGGMLDKRTHGRGDGQPGRQINTFPVPPGPLNSQTPQQGFAAPGEAAPIMQERECGARPGCQRVPLGPVGPRPRPPPGHRDPRPRLSQRC